MSDRLLVAAALALGVLSRVEERAAGVSLGLSSDAAWVTAAFAAGAVAGRGGAALRGAVALTVANAAYYLTILLTESIPPHVAAGSPARWFVLGVAGGAVFGVAGAAWARGAPTVRAAGAVACGGVLIADGASAITRGVATHALSLVVGAVLVATSAPRRVLGAATAAAMVLLASTGVFEPLLP
ncbi:DUF6518 family protein [Conexibacter sp. SYSU D00693]|uniref:DUF6518 family protein n=1 Tax=Conexibacter sp. SYSU D00693 TaxID=2812560 RepID=UPI00196A937C|nr:DUF6518 family protein [Conexibacter sp. SYSU D00693]